MNALGHILRRIGLALVALTEEAPTPPQAAPRAPAEPPQAPPELRDHAIGRRLGPDETAELLARYAGRDEDSDPDALDLEALRAQGRVAHRIDRSL